jgi:hypothetical protein
VRGSRRYERREPLGVTGCVTSGRPDPSFSPTLPVTGRMRRASRRVGRSLGPGPQLLPKGKPSARCWWTQFYASGSPRRKGRRHIPSVPQPRPQHASRSPQFRGLPPQDRGCPVDGDRSRPVSRHDPGTTPTRLPARFRHDSDAFPAHPWAPRLRTPLTPSGAVRRTTPEKTLRFGGRGNSAPPSLVRSGVGPQTPRLTPTCGMGRVPEPLHEAWTAAGPARRRP